MACNSGSAPTLAVIQRMILDTGPKLVPQFLTPAGMPGQLGPGKENIDVPRSQGAGHCKILGGFIKSSVLDPKFTAGQVRRCRVLVGSDHIVQKPGGAL